LTDVAVAAIGATRPSEENIARRLHQTLTGNDSFTVIVVQALPSIRFQNRCPGFFDLQKKWIIVGRQKESNAADSADTADADDRNRYITKMKTIE